MSVGELLPCEGLQFCDWRQEANRTRRFGRSSRSVVTQTGPGYWVCRVKTGRLNLQQARRWSGFLTRREGQDVSFTAWRSWRAKPKGTMSVPDGNIGIVADIEQGSVNLTGVGNYLANEGDMISYRTEKGGFYCGEVVEGAESINDQITLKLWPRPQIPNPTPEVLRNKALAEFTLINPPPFHEDYSNRSLVFEARQLYR